MILSIVMMVRDEEKILEKTLKSLDSLRKEIENELIILDTGSTDNTVNICKKYTEKVYFEKWDDDFSSMRNKSISYANGEWILILDADEVLIKYDKLIKFLKSDEHKKYNCATINIKNLHENGNHKYSYCSILRLFKKKGFRYEGIIHEQPLYNHPIYNDILEVEHYGYLFEDEEFRVNKLKRNERLLLRQLRENPNNPYVNYQIGQNFIMDNNYIEAEFYIEKSLKLYKMNGISPEYIYITISKIYIALGKYKKCEELALEYIDRDNNNIDIYYYLAQSQFIQYRFEKSIEYFKRYIYLVDNYEISTQANSMFSNCETIFLRDDALVNIIIMMDKLENYNGVLEYYQKIEDSVKKRGCYFNLFKSLYKLNRFEEVFKYYDLIKSSNTDKCEFYNNMETFISTLRSTDKNNIYKYLSRIRDNYGLFNKIRYKGYCTLKECEKILYEEKNYIYGSILNLILQNNINLIEVVQDLDSIWIYKYIKYAIEYDKKIFMNLYNYIINVDNTFDFNKIRIYRIITKILLESNLLGNDKYFELFYIDNMYSYQYLRYIYKELNDDDILKILDNDYDRFCIEFRSLIQSNLSEKDKVKKLNKLIKEYPYYKKIIEKLIEDIKQDILESDEFKELKVKFIKNIIDMINSNQIKEAKIAIYEYITVFRENSEIFNIRGVIQFLEGNIKEANMLFKKSLSFDIYNEDTIYNIENINKV